MAYLIINFAITQSVFLCGGYWDSMNLTCISQGSVLGQILYNIYTQPLGTIGRKHDLKQFLLQIQILKNESKKSGISS